MSCYGGTHCYLCGFTVTYFTDSDNIRVLTEYGTKTAGKGHACFFVYLYLVYAVYVVFDGIFKSNKVYKLCVKLSDH